jgi:hypothetical protein
MAAETAPQARAWSLPRRVAFRFVFSYVLLYALPFPLDALPWGWGDQIGGAWLSLWGEPVKALGRVLFGLDVAALATTGSGDSTYSYLQVLLFALLAAAAALVWSLLDRRRADYARLADWLRVYVRMYVAVILFSYGAAKVIKGGQFPYPPPSRLLQPFGDASPMGLLWTFMGASASYNFFTGAGEMLGGLLLIARRTSLLGALVCTAVMGHVVALNMSYDVPVKLFSLHLLAFSMLLAAPDVPRLLDFFVRNRPVPAADLRPLLADRRRHGVAVGLRTALLLLVAAWLVRSEHQSSLQYGDGAKKPPLFGAWSVDEMTVDGVVRPALLTDTERWRWVVFDRPQVIAILTMDDRRERYALAADYAAHRLTLTERNGKAAKGAFDYHHLAADRIEMQGSFEGHRIAAMLRRVPLKDQRLLSRGFHWINEVPYNR